MSNGPIPTDPFASVRWDLAPGRTALLLIDYQNDFLHEDGWYARSGIDISHMRRVIEPSGRLVEAARAEDVPVIWTRHGSRDERDAGTFFQLRPFLREGGLRQGTWGYEIYDALTVAEEDWIVEKVRLSAFFNTNLEVILRGLGTETSPGRGRAHEPVHRGDLEGRLLSRLQADRRRRVHRDDAAAPARAGARDGQGGLGRGPGRRRDDLRAGDPRAGTA